ncbi:MAG TPA: class I SAM-dependent methyltransferase [Verrucomicrobiae bacterium]|nr:class I SAM-dependent methyltransferase [Verrucomicrobiae bacterium]
MNAAPQNPTAPSVPQKPRRDLISILLERFHRSPLVKVYNYHAYRLLKFAKSIAASVGPDDVVLDVGAGDCQYKPLFAGRCKYLSQDVGGKDKAFSYDQIDIRSEIYDIPLPDESVTVILCTQVLEHLQYPARALKEMYRLLKPGGRVCLTVPFAADEHMLPYDYFRYTRYGLDFLFREQGFLPPKIDPQGGRFIFFGKMIKDLFPMLVIKRVGLQRAIYLVQAPVVVPLLVILYFLDKIDRNTILTQNYDVVARKPGL